MDWKALNKMVSPILGSILFLAVGFLVLWIAKTKFNIQQEAILISLVLLPILLYLILSGKLQGFSAGGVSATFNDAAQKPVIKDENVEPLAVKCWEKGGMDRLPEYLAELDTLTTEYVALALLLHGHYTNKGLLTYLERMSSYANFKFLIVFEWKGREKSVFAYMPVRQAIGILKAEGASEIEHGPFTTAINEGQKDRLLDYDEMIRLTVSTTDTNLKALEKLTEKKMEELIVTDKNRVVQGVVERKQLLSKLFLAMTK